MRLFVVIEKSESIKAVAAYPLHQEAYNHASTLSKGSWVVLPVETFESFEEARRILGTSEWRVFAVLEDGKLLQVFTSFQSAFEYIWNAQGNGRQYAIKEVNINV